MNARVFANVLASFMGEAVTAFSFLSDEFGLAGPDRQGGSMLSVAYVGSGVRYRVGLDADDKAVVVEAERDVDEGRLVAQLPRLVWATDIGSASQVTRNASIMHNLKRSLETQATFLRQLHPILVGPDAMKIMLKAGARRWRL